MNIRFSGFGGQGIILSGVILGWAAVLDGKNAIQTQSYGSSARGGSCKCDVIIQESAIYELEPEHNDILITFSQPSYNAFIKSLKEGGHLFYDSDLVTVDTNEFPCNSIPATDIAFKEFKQKIYANMLMLGFLAEKIRFIGFRAIEKSISQYVPTKTIEMNIAAFRMGIDLAK
ncbi:MAG: 2-oxoglutarate synthase [Ignavibacteria bacterium]|nr:2-oxoglutarate synthase [Ignavibacteria bacterium]